MAYTTTLNRESTLFGETFVAYYDTDGIYCQVDSEAPVKVVTIAGERPVMLAQRVDPADGALVITYFSDAGATVTKTSTNTGQSWS